jgi:hypothetical protein
MPSAANAGGKAGVSSFPGRLRNSKEKARRH